jgi:membrane-bound lytic murein transglycosylase F
MKSKWSLKRCALLLIACFMISACEGASTLERIKQRGELRVAMRTGPTLYFVDRHGPDGFELQLASAFAKSLNVALRVIPANNIEDSYTLLRKGRVDIAAAGLIIDAARLSEFRYSPAYLPNQPILIYRTGSDRPKSLPDLEGKTIATLAGGFNARQLQSLAEQYPQLDAEIAHDLETADLLERVANGSLDYALLPRHVYLAYRGSFSRLSASLKPVDLQQQGWAIARNKPGSAALYNHIDSFFLAIQQEGRLNEWSERYFGHNSEVNYVSSLQYAHNIERRLPKYEAQIKRSASMLGIEWELLAAISYQESLWNPNAVSPTGVRGMMMLTHNAAKEVNVTDRRDVDQSLMGGAAYYLHVRAQIPERIVDPDRTWFALAAYNVGLGHLEDARVITEREGADPDKWIDVKRHLPLLRQKKWYSKTKYGFARGNEPVTYVQNIRNYYDVLKLRERTRYRKPPIVNMQHRAPALFEKIPAAI